MILNYNEYYKTKKEIINWLKLNNVYNYNVNNNLEVDVDEVDLRHHKLQYLPVKFNCINGDFTVGFNNLKNLKGCPNFVGGRFYCGENPLLEDITDLNSVVLISSIKQELPWTTKINMKLYDDYFEKWITKDINIVNVLKNKVSDNIKDKYNHYFDATNFDLI